MGLKSSSPHSSLYKYLASKTCLQQPDMLIMSNVLSSSSGLHWGLTSSKRTANFLAHAVRKELQHFLLSSTKVKLTTTITTANAAASAAIACKSDYSDHYSICNHYDHPSVTSAAVATKKPYYVGYDLHNKSANTVIQLCTKFFTRQPPKEKRQGKKCSRL